MASVIDAKTTSNKDSEVEVAANGHGENGSSDTSVAVAENGSAHSAAADKAGKDGEKKEDSSPEISTSKLLSFATPCETAFIYIATFFSYVSSLSTPFVAYLFGSIISRFGKSTKALCSSRITSSIYLGLREYLNVLPCSTGNSQNPGAELVDLGPDTTFLLLAGLGAFVIGFVGEFLWKYTSANQSMRMREAFVDAVFKQEIAFFESVSFKQWGSGGGRPQRSGSRTVTHENRNSSVNRAIPRPELSVRALEPTCRTLRRDSAKIWLPWVARSWGS